MFPFDSLYKCWVLLYYSVAVVLFLKVADLTKDVWPAEAHGRRVQVVSVIKRAGKVITVPATPALIAARRLSALGWPKQSFWGAARGGKVHNFISSLFLLDRHGGRVQTSAINRKMHPKLSLYSLSDLWRHASKVWNLVPGRYAVEVLHATNGRLLALHEGRGQGRLSWKKTWKWSKAYFSNTCSKTNRKPRSVSFMSLESHF